MSGDKTDWSLKIKNADNRRIKVISNWTRRGLKHISLDKGPRLTNTLGVVATKDLLNMLGHGSMNFLKIKLASGAGGAG